MSLRRLLSMSLAMAARRSVGKLSPETTVFLLCDIQERFRPLIWRGKTVIRTAQYLTSVAKALDIPIVITQQYTKVFGETISDTFADPEHMKQVPKFEKKKFSMCTDEVRSHLDTLNKPTVVIFGIEAHVCVQQTCLDLLEDGKEVHIIADSVSSQQPYDREIALTRMNQAGAFLTTAQSAAFMLMQSAEHANFKTVSKLTVDHMKFPNNEFNAAAMMDGTPSKM
jgi:nicotinamidase-related amidase